MQTSVTDRAMLIDLQVSQWSARKNDRKVAHEVAENHNSDEDMGRYHKQLLGKDALEKIRKVAGRMRDAHYRRTLPWSDNGPRILSGDGYFDYTAEFRKLQAEYDEAVTEFEIVYPQKIEEARRRLNGLFRSDEYPPVSRIRDKFKVSIEVLPIPKGEDVRVDLGNDLNAKIRQEVEENTNRRIELAMASAWGRLRDVVANMAAKLRAYTVTDNGVTGIFRDTLVSNIRDLLDLLPTLNITGSRELADFASRIESELLVAPDALRSDEGTRNEVAAKAEEILRKMEEFI